jgi:hypothetical protein
VWWFDGQYPEIFILPKNFSLVNILVYLSSKQATTENNMSPNSQIMPNEEFKLPMRLARTADIRPREHRDMDGGWHVFRCKSAQHVLDLMRAYPAARMPCWGWMQPKLEAHVAVSA